MLSRREKLLIQPWEARRFKDHRSKVTSALPAIDDHAPIARPHVALKLKKWRRELDRAAQIQSDNFFLLQRLSAVMKVNRLDNRWTKPLPNFHRKVGQFYDVAALNSKLDSHNLTDSSDELFHSTVKCYACEHKKMKSKPIRTNTSEAEDSLPLLNLKM